MEEACKKTCILPRGVTTGCGAVCETTGLSEGVVSEKRDVVCKLKLK